MRPLIAILWLASVIFVTPVQARPTNPRVSDSTLLRLRDDDAALGAVAWRLAFANASLCADIMPGTGVILHARNQYRSDLAPQVERLFGLAGAIGIVAVVPGSPADRAGLKAGDSVVSAAGVVPPAPDADGKPDTLVRDALEAELAGLPPAAPMVWQVLRGGRALAVEIKPDPVCKVRFELVAGKKLVARNTGSLIQISAGYLDLLDPGSVAAAVAHELAHTVLLHRSRLAAAGVDKGLLAEFGRSGQLNRLAEREADALSVYLLRNAGYDPALAVELWRRHGGRIAGGLLRSRTHDSPADRIARIQSEIDAIPVSTPVPAAPVWLRNRLVPLR